MGLAFQEVYSLNILKVRKLIAAAPDDQIDCIVKTLNYDDEKPK